MIPSPEFPIMEAVTIMVRFGVVITIGIVRSFGGSCPRYRTPDERYSLAHAVSVNFFSILNLVRRKHLVLSHDALLLYAFPAIVAQSHSSTAVHGRTLTAPTM
jgi:hypothetical protein